MHEPNKKKKRICIALLSLTPFSHISDPEQSTLNETHFTRQHTENPFVQIHNGMIAALVSVNGGIRVQADYKIVAFLLGDFQKVQVSYVEEIKRPRYVHNLVARLRRLAVAELYNFLRGRQELRAASPRISRGSILTHPLTWLSVDAIFTVTLSKMLSRHQKHAAHEISSRNTGSSLNFSGIRSRRFFLSGKLRDLFLTKFK